MLPNGNMPGCASRSYGDWSYSREAAGPRLGQLPIVNMRGWRGSWRPYVPTRRKQEPWGRCSASMPGSVSLM